MEVRLGYKQTEAGVIPEDWKVMTLGEIGDVRMCKRVLKHQTRENGEVPFYKIGTFGAVADAFISHALFDEFKRKYWFPKKGDVLISAAGTIGRAVVYDGAPAYFQDSNIVWIDNDESHAINAFLWHRYRVTKWDVSHGGTVARLYNDNLRTKIHVPVPSLLEQDAIATALSDVDALLGGLDRLIAKKRDLKQAVMQQLLTGQTRLPRFSGEWKVKRLGDHVTFLRHGVNSRAELVPEGRVKYIHYGEVHASEDVYLAPASLPCLPEAKAAALDRLRDGDLVFADASEDIAGVSKSVEIRNVSNTELVSGLHTIAARFDKNVLADGFKGFLQFCPPFAAHLRRLAAGTKVYATNRAHVASVEMHLPSVAEQTAIAAVLSDMDAELAALEARRNKTRELKQAMMQELLTGKTRLVRAGAVRA